MEKKKHKKNPLKIFNYFISLPACHVTITRCQKTVNVLLHHWNINSGGLLSKYFVSKGLGWWKHWRIPGLINRRCLSMSNIMYRDVSLVDVMFSSFLGDEQHLIEQEEGSLVFGAVDVKRSFQNQLAVCGQIRTIPVYEQRLDLLCAQ